MKKNEIEDIGSLVKALRQETEGFGKTSYWFRGHADASWTLIPSVHRHYDQDGERNLIGRFLWGAGTRYAACPDIQDPARWLCLAQHHGLPTRLLDWTTSLMVAIFFAVAYKKEPKKDAAIWILSPSAINGYFGCSAVTHSLHGPEVVSLVAAPFDAQSVKMRKIMAVMGTNVDHRMMVQQGAFTVHGDPTSLESVAEARGFVRQITIPAKAKSTLEEELWVMGIRQSSIFPDLTNLAEDLAGDFRLIPRK